MVEEKSEGIAAVLSLVIPGAGQMYAGQVGRGVGFLVGFIIGLFLLIIPGIIVWIVSIVDAMSCARKYNAEHTMRCPRCMNSIPRGALVCTMCGTQLLPVAYAQPMMQAPVLQQPMTQAPMMGAPMPMPVAQQAQAAAQRCPGCGQPITWHPQHNRWWCAAENKWL